MRVLIVSKTHMGEPGVACVGGVSREPLQSLRLLNANGQYPNPDQYQIGEVWEVTGQFARHLDPPHVENFLVQDRDRRENIQFPKKWIRENFPTWEGDVNSLFDGTLTVATSGSAYLSEENPAPLCSTGFWLPTSDLALEPNGTHYRLHGSNPGRLKFVGYEPPIPRIPAGTLCRVSLARWWKREPHEERRCYLQLSGWYD